MEMPSHLMGVGSCRRCVPSFVPRRIKAAFRSSLLFSVCVFAFASSALAQTTLNPATLSFGNQALSEPSTARTATLRNTQAVPLTIFSIKIANGNAAGDYVSGTRTLALPSATSLSATLPLSYNMLCGDSVDFTIYLNTVAVGSFSALAGESSVPISATFPRISGPTYTLEYLENRTVSAGAGAISIMYDAGSVTLSY